MPRHPSLILLFPLLVSGCIPASVSLSSVIIDGQPVNHKAGYDRSYEFHQLDDTPAFFCEKGGKIGLNVGGVETPLPWQEIRHYGCCSASLLNPHQVGNVLPFFARQAESWFFLELHRIMEG